jgi:predicted TIM-barrel fold metal-dependent hydrolase
MGKPIAFHAAYNWRPVVIAHQPLHLGCMRWGSCGSTWFHMTNWVINGLPERFPKLKVLWIESGLT